MSLKTCDQYDSQVLARQYKFRLGWSTVHGSAEPITSIIDDDPVWGPERKIWHHVLRLSVHHGILTTIIRWLRERLPSALQRRISKWFPGAFLPDTVIVKTLKPDWDEEFDTEISMYGRLKPIQGVVVPVFYGETQVDDGDGGTRAMLLSDVGGKQLAVVSCGDYEADDLRGMLKTAIGAIYRLGVSPCDANLVNCHVVAGNRIMIVDHEQDEELDDEKSHHVEELIEAKVDSIMERYWSVQQSTEEMDHEAERRANDEWRARYGHIVLGCRARD
ncbi:hypothetical protein CONLIGDRAFT_667740 [Coniochaeta ligniaria NRRL 30616]|uniref:Aminoglycoside phosphotransferase domain-containing protein n=1 Tax=Coniochaeta ligniaria NRRL 30616 TaxID=1408157 RepID=A0A1J7IXL0_9PEZI|nr:hypothetical protein CONLIGDRAFT_667740 [Coniochaeta ligniaria NRRL 30616]